MPTHNEQRQFKLAALILPAIVALVTSTVPVAITGYVTLKSSKSESESGYKVMVDSVKELQGVVADQGKEIARLNGQVSAWTEIIKGLERQARRTTVRPLAALAPECASDADCGEGAACSAESKCVRPAEPLPVKAAPVFKPLPGNLSEAVQQVAK